jgi:hypothetical protein
MGFPQISYVVTYQLGEPAIHVDVILIRLVRDGCITHIGHSSLFVYVYM